MWYPFKVRREKKREAERIAEHNRMTWYAPAWEALGEHGGWNPRFGGRPSVILTNANQQPYKKSLRESGRSVGRL